MTKFTNNTIENSKIGKFTENWSLKIENSDVKQLISGFYFPNPDWSNLPGDFPKLSKKGLSKEESHLLDGIKLAWVTSEGRETLYKTTAKRAFVGIVIVILILLGGSLLTRPENSITKSVSAKTVTQAVEDIVVSTMSAVFRK